MVRFAFLLLLLLASAGARADTLTWRFDFFPQAGFTYLWGWFGNDMGPYTGTITSATLVMNGYSTSGGADAADFYFTFDVPTLGPETHIGLTGTDLGWSGSGPFSHSFTTDLYNGEIRPGRFGAEVSGGGEFSGDFYIEFTIDGYGPDLIFADSFDTPDT